MQAPRLRVCQIQLTHGPRHAHVAKSTFLLDAARFVRRHAMRKQAFFQTRQEYDRKFEPLGRVQRHHLHRRAGFRLLFARVQSHLIEKLLERGGRGRVGVLQWKHQLAGELPTGAHQFFEVFLACKTALTALFAVILHEPAGIDDKIGKLMQRHVGTRRRQIIDHLQEPRHAARQPAFELAFGDGVLTRLPQRHGAFARLRSYGFDSLTANASRRGVHNTLECRIGMPVVNQAHVRERVLDFRTLEEPHTAIYSIRNICA